MRDREQRPESRQPRTARPMRTTERPATEQVPAAGRVTPSNALAMQQAIGNAAVAREIGSQAQRGAAATRTGGAPSVQRMERVREEPPGPSVAVDFPAPPKQPWWQVLFCGSRDKAADEWTKFRDEVRRLHPQADTDPQVRFSDAQRSVLVNYDTRTLNNLYPHLVYKLAEQARKHLNNQLLGPVDTLKESGKESGITRAHWAAQDDRERVLRQEAATEAHVTPAPARQNPVDQQTGLQPAAALQALINSNADGFLIGERHKEPHAWDFLAANIGAARAAGLRTIFLESVRSGAQQNWVDQYLGGANPPQLNIFLDRNRADKNHDGLRTLLAAVRAVGGIRVRAADTLVAEKRSVQGASQAQRDWKLHERAAMMNTYAADAVRTDQQSNPGKYVILVGESHASYHSFSGDRTALQGEPAELVGDGGSNPGLPDRVPGVAQYLNIPAVRLSDPSSPVPIASIPL